MSHLTTARLPVSGTLSSTSQLHLTGPTVVLEETNFGPELARVDEWNAAISSVMGGRIVLVTSGFYPSFGFAQQFRVTSNLLDVKKSEPSAR